MTKNEIRTLYKQNRRKISAADKVKMEDLMLIQFQKLPDFNKYTIMSYVPIVAQNEYNPYLPEAWYHLFNDDTVFIFPKMNVVENTITGYIVDDETPFETNIYGVDEPMSVVKIQPQDIHIMFVPLIAFSKTGHRVGYGKGYYDKYIALCDPKMIKIGFSFFDAIEIDDVNELDQKLDYCVTPNALYSF